jgi:hypothetical protein
MNNPKKKNLRFLLALVALVSAAGYISNHYFATVCEARIAKKYWDDNKYLLLYGSNRETNLPVNIEKSASIAPFVVVVKWRYYSTPLSADSNRTYFFCFFGFVYQL